MCRVGSCRAGRVALGRVAWSCRAGRVVLVVSSGRVVLGRVALGHVTARKGEVDRRAIRHRRLRAEKAMCLHAVGGC